MSKRRNNRPSQLPLTEVEQSFHYHRRQANSYQESLRRCAAEFGVSVRMIRAARRILKEQGQQANERGQ